MTYKIGDFLLEEFRGTPVAVVQIIGIGCGSSYAKILCWLQTGLRYTIDIDFTIIVQDQETWVYTQISEEEALIYKMGAS
jgi:hypothetical protein